MNRNRDLRPCGTEAAYRRHRRYHEMPCEPCYLAHAAYVRNTRPSRAKARLEEARDD